MSAPDRSRPPAGLRTLLLHRASALALASAALLATALAYGGGRHAHDDDDDRDARDSVAATPVRATPAATAAAVPEAQAAYRQECAACHLAYPASLLPADAWRRVMGGLAHHYGVDASLDDASTRQAVTDWLVAHAGTGRRVRDVGPDDRITRSPWFLRKHDEVPAGAWTRPSVKSASQCSACHAQAEQGDFDEHGVRIPR